MPKTDVYINRRSHGSLMNDVAYTDLKTKITFLEDAYNIILKHLCKKKNIDKTHNYFNAIKQELNDVAKKYDHLLCLTTVGTNTNVCPEPMFDDMMLRQLVDAMYKDAFLNKACLYRDENGKYQVNIHIGGAHKRATQFIDINKLLQEKLPSLYDQSFICVQFENKIACTNIKSEIESEQKCDFCEKWTMERNMFRNAVNDIINSSNLNKAIELMTASTHLLPSAILDQKQYNKFLSAIEAYKKYISGKH